MPRKEQSGSIELELRRHARFQKLELLSRLTPVFSGDHIVAATDISPELWRTAAVALCEFACGPKDARSKDDPVYAEVTEGRDGPGPEERKRYSSCGDLAHWLYKRLGIREPWLNRTDDYMFGPWKPGENIIRLWGKPCPIDRVPPSDSGWIPQPGDVVLIWNTGFDAHVMVALGHDGGLLRTGNYGAGGMSPLAFPGSKIASKALTFQLGKPFYGTRQIQRVLPLEEAVAHVTAPPDLTGASLTREQLNAFDAAFANSFA